MIGRGAERGKKGNSGAGLAAVPSLCLFFRYLSAFKVYAMKNAPQFGGLLLVSLGFVFFPLGLLLRCLLVVISNTLRRKSS